MHNLIITSRSYLNFKMNDTIKSCGKFNSKGQMIEELDDYIDTVISPDGLNSVSVSILGKRKFNDAFDSNTFDDARYGQNIDTDFFNKNVGHSVSQVSENKVPKNNIERKDDENISSHEDELEILKWCEYYRANRNLFNV